MTISIITASYNSKETIRDTIESVLRQTWHNFEYIIVDGGSEDGTMDIVKEYKKVFEGKLHYLSEPDYGVYDAMNKGLRMATGDVVGFLNSDDYYTTNDVLQTVAEAFEMGNIDAVYGDVHYVSATPPYKRTRYYSSRLFSRFFMRFGFMPAHPSFYCRREIYDKYGNFDTSFRIAADFEILLRFIFIHRIRTKYISRDFVTMRNGGLSNRKFSNRKEIMKDHVRALKKNSVYSNRFLLSLRYLYKIIELIRR